MKIIFAQGNPGTSYNGTRHNVGFAIVDELAKKQGTAFSHKAKFHADIAETVINSEKVLFVKPTTFYNETGPAARSLIDFYKLNPSKDFLVIHDELALPLGTVKIRHSGSDAGNNGVKSLNAHLGNNYARIRIGVFQPLRDRINDVDFVLGKFTKEEQASLHTLLPSINAFIADFLHGSLAATKISSTPGG